MYGVLIKALRMQSSTLSTLLWLVQCLLVVRASGFALLERSPTPTPIAIAPAQNWYIPIT